MKQQFKVLIRNPSMKPQSAGFEPYGEYFDLAPNEERSFVIECDSEQEVALYIDLTPEHVVITGSQAS